MVSTIRIKDYGNNKETEYKEVDERNPLPVVIAGGVIGGTNGDIPVFDGNINIESVGGEPVEGVLRVELTPEQAAALTSPGTQQVAGTVTIGNQKLDVMLLNDTVNVGGKVEVTNPNLTVTLANASLPVTDNGGSLTVDGTITVGNTNLPVTFSNTSIVVSDGGEALTVKGSVALTNAAIPVTDNGGSLTVDGTVAVSNFPDPVTSVAVSNFPAPITSVAVSNFPAPVTSVSVNNQPATYPVTDNGGSLTVDGTVTTVPSGTTTVAGTVAVSNQPTVYPITDNNGSITVDGTVTIVPSGTQTVTGTVTTSPSGTQTVSSNAPSLNSGSTGLTAYRNPALLATPVQVKSGGSRIHQYHFGNPNSATVFVHIYNALSANVVVGTTVPLATYMVAANAALDGYWPNSLTYSVGITLAATTTAAGSTAPAVGVLAGIGYV
jgi:hypothetical protein